MDFPLQCGWSLNGFYIEFSLPFMEFSGAQLFCRFTTVLWLGSIRSETIRWVCHCFLAWPYLAFPYFCGLTTALWLGRIRRAKVFGGHCCGFGIIGLETVLWLGNIRLCHVLVDLPRLIFSTVLWLRQVVARLFWWLFHVGLATVCGSDMFWRATVLWLLPY